jgi:hypothetical protein
MLASPEPFGLGIDKPNAAWDYVWHPGAWRNGGLAAQHVMYEKHLARGRGTHHSS